MNPKEQTMMVMSNYQDLHIEDEIFDEELDEDKENVIEELKSKVPTNMEDKKPFVTLVEEREANMDNKIEVEDLIETLESKLKEAESRISMYIPPHMSKNQCSK